MYSQSIANKYNTRLKERALKAAGIPINEETMKKGLPDKAAIADRLYIRGQQNPRFAERFAREHRRRLSHLKLNAARKKAKSDTQAESLRKQMRLLERRSNKRLQLLVRMNEDLGARSQLDLSNNPNDAAYDTFITRPREEPSYVRPGEIDKYIEFMLSARPHELGVNNAFVLNVLDKRAKQQRRINNLITAKVVGKTQAEYEASRAIEERAKLRTNRTPQKLAEQKLAFDNLARSLGLPERESNIANPLEPSKQPPKPRMFDMSSLIRETQPGRRTGMTDLSDLISSSAHQMRLKRQNRYNP